MKKLSREKCGEIKSLELEKLFDSFCLEGKISEGHAKEIKMLLFSFEKEIKKKIVKKVEKWNESGYYSDCVGKHGWEELLDIIESIN